jgi:hypothetical protein
MSLGAPILLSPLDRAPGYIHRAESAAEYISEDLNYFTVNAAAVAWAAMKQRGVIPIARPGAPWLPAPIHRRRGGQPGQRRGLPRRPASTLRLWPASPVVTDTAPSRCRR